MNLKRKIAASAAVLLLIGSAMNVSAAELASKDYVNKLIKNHQAELIINVDAYKAAAYSDLAKAFGDDTDAYINHYLTKGVYEGRTKGVLFDPLVYAEAYRDIKNALGYDIDAIVQHYLTFGISENRTQGTAHGYADIAAAEKAGVQNTNINRAVGNAGGNGLSSNYSDSGDSSLNNNTAGNVSQGNSGTAENSSKSSNTTVADNSGSTVNNDTVSSSSSNNSSIAAADNSGSAASVSADSASANTGKGYDHTTVNQ